MASNPTSFQNNKLYKIRSVVDGSLLDLQAGNVGQGTEIHVWQNTGTGQQIWKASQESNGHRLASQLNPGGTLRVIDMSLGGKWHSGIYYDFHGGLNQQFYTKVVEGFGNGVVMILTPENNFALRSQGRGCQVQFVRADTNDISQMWKLEYA